MVEIRIGAPLYAISTDQFRNMCESSGCIFVGTVQGDGGSSIWIIHATDAVNVFYLGTNVGVVLSQFSMKILDTTEKRFKEMERP